ncbi:hypothetical protein L598_000200001870 [Mesorhizobium sp. J18]|uniref:DUF305 domain-containing protein n=1 Tax=Mesorhizobium sp. J18 TaxID=935263 RepID=UPI001199B35A|nr:DUF305 domain-containing protein [Mesorhizobium sp. J18]TWG98048.1 hypothetical protein L598_000200001870 [Mesorhizobium sp. J18]
MFPAIVRTVLFTTFAASALITGLHAQTDHGGTHRSGSDASQAYMDAMTRMDEEMRAMKMTGKPGADFAAMMIPHHQSAIDMAKAYLASGENDPELAKLAEEIIEAQESEIGFLKKWLSKNGR